MKYYARFERPRDDAYPILLGPFSDFLQLTYGDLRIGSDGATIAQFDAGADDWFITDSALPASTLDGNESKPAVIDINEPWSDIIIYAE